MGLVAFEQSFPFFKNLIENCPLGALAGNHVHVVGGKRGTAVTKRFPDEPFETVSFWGGAKASRRADPKPCHLGGSGIEAEKEPDKPFPMFHESGEFASPSEPSVFRKSYPRLLTHCRSL